MTEFKKGDRVMAIDNYGKVLKGDLLTVRSGPTGTSAGGNYYFKEIQQVMLGDDLKLASAEGIKPLKINFLLCYELDEDPIEEFETLAQVRKRIGELLEDDSLKRDSLKVYEVKSVKAVTIRETIVLK